MIYEFKLAPLDRQTGKLKECVEETPVMIELDLTAFLSRFGHGGPQQIEEALLLRTFANILSEMMGAVILYRPQGSDAWAHCIPRIGDMKPSFEIGLAHDLLTMVLTGEIEIDKPVFDDTESRKLAIVTADALCWVLNHKHNEQLDKNIAEVRRELDAGRATVKISPARTVEGWHPVDEG